jgi:hypothetical protein
MQIIQAGVKKSFRIGYRDNTPLHKQEADYGIKSQFRSQPGCPAHLFFRMGSNLPFVCHYMLFLLFSRENRFFALLIPLRAVAQFELVKVRTINETALANPANLCVFCAVGHLLFFFDDKT